MTFYDDMQDFASEMLVEFSQGVVTLTRTIPGTPDPAEPWEPVVDVVETYRLDAVAKSVSDKFVDGTTILATDTEITAAATMDLESVTGGGGTLGPTQVEIKPGDGVTIDGQAVAVLKVMRIPRAGTCIAWRLIVRS